MELTEHPKTDNSFTLNMATEEAVLTIGVRWFSKSGEHKGGVPLEDDSEQVYCFHDGKWCASPLRVSHPSRRFTSPRHALTPSHATRCAALRLATPRQASPRLTSPRRASLAGMTHPTSLS